MSIPRKGARKIVVAGRAFLWSRPTRPRMYGDAPRVIRLVVQEDVKAPGQPLVLDLVTKHSPCEDDWDVHRASLLPSDIERVIREAMNQGWDPASRGALFKLGGSLELSDYRYAG